MSPLYLLLIFGYFLLTLALDEPINEDFLHEYREHYENFTKKFKRHCNDNDKKCLRKKLAFVENMKKLEEHQKRTQGKHKLGLTKFMDETQEERTARLINKALFSDKQRRAEQIERVQESEGYQQSLPSPIPTTWDWRTHNPNPVPPIKDQGQCGSCWAFAAAATMEIQVNIWNKTNVDFSEQYLVDCDTYSYGCDGGDSGYAYSFSNRSGIPLESDYAKYSAETNNCHKPSKLQRPTRGPKYFQANDIQGMMSFTSAIGPIAIAILVPQEIYYYESGIFYPNQDDCSLNNSLGGHAMAVIGYGSENGEDYWLVRNSWGEDFGENGYIRFKKGVDNCKIESMEPVAPINYGAPI